MNLASDHADPATGGVRTRSMRPNRIAALVGIIALAAMALPAGPVRASGGTAASLPNSWVFRFSQATARGVRATCSLGGARSTDIAVNVYVSAESYRPLDIVQVGARVRPDGSYRFFAAWGRGVPGADDSMYTEHDLGRADRKPHSFQVDLSPDGTTWHFRIDGKVVWSVQDASFRNWPISSWRAAIEGEGASDPLGGTQRLPTSCDKAKLLRTATLIAARGTPRWRPATWFVPTWNCGGYRIPVGTRWSCDAKSMVRAIR